MMPIDKDFNFGISQMFREHLQMNIIGQLLKKKKIYFKYPNLTTMHNALSDIKITERNNIKVNLIKSGFTDLKEKLA